jgi:hypothetical protein
MMSLRWPLETRLSVCGAPKASRRHYGAKASSHPRSAIKFDDVGAAVRMLLLARATAQIKYANGMFSISGFRLHAHHNRWHRNRLFARDAENSTV